MKQKRFEKTAQGGFTLIEIMVVVVILGILAAIVVPKVMDRPDTARITKAKQDIRALEGALNLYKLDNYNYPSTDQGLTALVEKPAGTPEPRNWKAGGYVDRLPKDPWGQPYQYLSPGSHGEIDIFTYGADSRPGGEGVNADIGNWNLEWSNLRSEVRGKTIDVASAFPKVVARSSRGFTLIEVLVVLILIGITVGLATLSVGSAGARQAEEEARRLAALIGLASDEAVLKSEELGIRFRPDGYEFLVLAPDNTWKRPGENGGDDVLRPRTLPPGFMLSATVDGLVIRFDKPKEPAAVAPHGFLLSSGERSAFEVELGPVDGVHYRLKVPVIGKLTVTLVEPPVRRQ